MKKLTHIVHYPDGSKEEVETTMADLNVFLRDHVELQLYRLEKKLEEKIDWVSTLCHIAVWISIVSSSLSAFAVVYTIKIN